MSEKSVHCRCLDQVFRHGPRLALDSHAVPCDTRLIGAEPARLE